MGGKWDLVLLQGRETKTMQGGVRKVSGAWCKLS